MECDANKLNRISSKFVHKSAIHTRSRKVKVAGASLKAPSPCAYKGLIMAEFDERFCFMFLTQLYFVFKEEPFNLHSSPRHVIVCFCERRSSLTTELCVRVITNCSDEILPQVLLFKAFLWRNVIHYRNVTSRVWPHECHSNTSSHFVSLSFVIRKITSIESTS
jgi:hypothetical protein